MGTISSAPAASSVVIGTAETRRVDWGRVVMVPLSVLLGGDRKSTV